MRSIQKTNKKVEKMRYFINFNTLGSVFVPKSRYFS